MPPFYLRLVPFFSLCNVFGSNGFVLHADVPQSSSEVGLRHIHLDLHLSVLNLALQLTDFLQGVQKKSNSARVKMMYKQTCE